MTAWGTFVSWDSLVCAGGQNIDFGDSVRWGLWPLGIHNNNIGRQALERLTQRYLGEVRRDRLV